LGVGGERNKTKQQNNYTIYMGTHIYIYTKKENKKREKRKLKNTNESVRELRSGITHNIYR